MSDVIIVNRDEFKHKAGVVATNLVETLKENGLDPISAFKYITMFAMFSATLEQELLNECSADECGGD